MAKEYSSVLAERPKMGQSLVPIKSKRRRQPPRTTSYGTIARPVLMKRANEYLARDGMLGLCSERGMGRHVLASDLAERHRMLEGSVCSIRMSPGSLDSSCRRLRKSILTSIEQTQAGDQTLVVIEGLTSMSEAYTTRVARCVKLAVVGNCKVLLVADADGERLFDCLPSCHVMRAQELLVSHDEYAAWANLLAGYTPEAVDRATHGIPALLATLGEARPSVLGLPEGQSWDRMAGVLFNDALRPGLIDEEQQVRCAMAALGSGSVAELESLGIRVSRDILEELAKGAPLFGADAKSGLFSVVPCDASVVAQSIELSLFNRHDFMATIVRMLAERGNIGRAATLAASLRDSQELLRLSCDFPLELIDVGLADLVRQTLQEDTEMSGSQDVFAREIMAHLGIVGFGLPHIEGSPSSVPERKMLELQLELLLQLDLVLSRRLNTSEQEHLAEIFEQGQTCESRVTRALTCIVRCVFDVCEGQIHKAFRHLMLNRDLRSQTGGALSLLSAILQLLYEMLHCLMNSSLTTDDFAQLELADFVLEKYAPEPLSKLLRAWRDAVVVLSGKKVRAEEFYLLLPYYAQRNQNRASACVHLLSALFCMPEAAYRQIHVHATEAYAQARLAGFSGGMALAALLECKVLCMAGEQKTIKQMRAKGLPPEIGAISGDVRTLFDRYSLLLAREQEETPGPVNDSAQGCAGADYGMPEPRPEIRTLAQYIVGADRECGIALGEALPALWHLSSRGRLLLAGEVGGGFAAFKPGVLPVEPVLAAPARQQNPVLLRQETTYPEDTSRVYSSRIMVSVLGTMAVYIDGQPLSDAQWKRQQPKYLLAQLALVPSHSLSRYEILEQLWPNTNYQRGRERLYTVMSALRKTLGQTGESVQYVMYEEGRVWLNRAYVECDIDSFEEVCRSIIAGESSNKDVIGACMELEKSYQTGSYIPAKDPSGFFKQRHIEIEKHLKSALSKGAKAARKQGDTSQAQWFDATIKTLH